MKKQKITGLTEDQQRQEYLARTLAGLIPTYEVKITKKVEGKMGIAYQTFKTEMQSFEDFQAAEIEKESAAVKRKQEKLLLKTAINPFLADVENLKTETEALRIKVNDLHAKVDAHNVLVSTTPGLKRITFLYNFPNIIMRM